MVVRQRLQRPRPHEDRTQGRRNRRTRQADRNDWAPDGDPAHHELVRRKFLGRRGNRQLPGNRDVDQHAGDRRPQRAQRNRPPRIFQIAREPHACGHAGKGRKANREHDEEALWIGDRLHQRVHPALGQAARPVAEKEASQRREQRGHDDIKRLHAEVRAFVQDQHSEQNRRWDRHQSRIKRPEIPLRLDDFEHRPKCFAERDDVKRDADRLREIQGHADRRPDQVAKRPRDNEILAAALDALVGGDLRDRHRGRNRHQMPQQNHAPRAEQADIPDRKTKPQEHHRAEDRRDRGQKDRRGAKLARFVEMF